MALLRFIRRGCQDFYLLLPPLGPAPLVLDRWIDPAHRYFKLRGDDGGIYILRYSASEDAWELTLFDSGSRDESRLSST
jgi:hypothetical protein